MRFKAKPKSKYKAVRTVVDGITFDSKAEASYYLILKNDERFGMIKILELQPKVYLTDARILAKFDFKIEENGKIVYLEVKGFETAVYKIKKRLWRHYGEGTLRVIKKTSNGFRIVEEIETKKTEGESK